MKTGTLILFAGKMGAGKSTKSKAVMESRNAVRISEDEWLSALYPGQIASFEDYIRHASLLKPLLKTHIAAILRTGIDVVMDFPANTVKQRQWFLEILTDAGAENELIYLDVSDEVCLEQIAKRRAEQPERAVFDTEAMFHEVTRYFQPPEESEGFNIRVVKHNG